MENVYSFVSNPQPLKNLVSTPIYKIMQKLNSGGNLNHGKDDGFDKFIHKDDNGNYCTRLGYDRSENDYVSFCELSHPDAYRNGIYKLGGYIFDFRPHFKKFLVKWAHYGWLEQYAPDKIFIKANAVTKGEILEILLLN